MALLLDISQADAQIIRIEDWRFFKIINYQKQKRYWHYYKSNKSFLIFFSLLKKRQSSINFFLDLNCTKEQGYCVSKNGWDQNAGVKRLDSLNEESSEREDKCLQACLSIQGVTGCELVWGQMNSGCYAHTKEVGLGNGAARHICWIMSKCQEVELSLTSPGRKIVIVFENKECLCEKI